MKELEKKTVPYVIVKSPIGMPGYWVAMSNYNAVVIAHKELGKLRVFLGEMGLTRVTGDSEVDRSVPETWA